MSNDEILKIIVLLAISEGTVEITRIKNKKRVLREFYTHNDILKAK